MTKTMATLHHLPALLLALAVSACGSGSDAETDTSTRGSAVYSDSQTDAAGQPQEPARPDPQRVDIEIQVAGSGSMSGLDPQCALDGTTGAFEGEYAGDAEIDGDGIYFGALASTAASFVTASGCPVPELEITSLTEVVVRAEMTATERNCQTYCAASARSQAEGECGTADSACRAEAEGEYAASCQVACTDGDDYHIVAETRLSAAAVAELTASSLTGTALGEIDVDLVFDRIENGDGAVVDEAP